MYNSRMRPYVSHFEGTNRIIEHIEKYVAPTITSTDLTGQPAFAFQPEDRPRAVFLIGEDEYQTELTLPAFAVKELEPLGIRCTMVIADPKSPHEFPGIESLADADLLVLSVRRRAPRADEMARIHKYLAAGKPLVGIRTACHAFDTRGKAPPGHEEWTSFDPEVLGGHYTGHFPNDQHAIISLSRTDEAHPILRGVTVPFDSQGSLYKTSPLGSGTLALLTGKIQGQPAEPVAWVRTHGPARVFYTSLGHPGDFKNASFVALLRNAIFWSLGRETPSTASVRRAQPQSGCRHDATLQQGRQLSTGCTRRCRLVVPGSR